jgi:hypothetical protein
MEFEVEFGGIEIEIKGVRGLLTLASLVLVGLAVARELQRPADQRTWTGNVLGAVPYDFRPPTLERLKEGLWNSERDAIWGPKVFGVGWTPNLRAVAKKLDLVA